MSTKGNKNKPGALEEFLEQQEQAANPASLVGNYRSFPLMRLKRKIPYFRLLLGASIGIPAIVSLILMLNHLAINWFNLIYPLLAIAFSALLIVNDIRDLRARRKIRKKNAKTEL